MAEARALSWLSSIKTIALESHFPNLRSSRAKCIEVWHSGPCLAVRKFSASGYLSDPQLWNEILLLMITNEAGSKLNRCFSAEKTDLLLTRLWGLSLVLDPSTQSRNSPDKLPALALTEGANIRARFSWPDFRDGGQLFEANDGLFWDIHSQINWRRRAKFVRNR